MATYFVWDEDFKLNVARGKVRGAEAVHKFGAVPQMSINTTGTIWDKNDTVYPWSSFDSAGVLVAKQANASDNGKKVTVFGLDDDFDEVSEEFTLSSSGDVTGSVSFRRVYRAYITEGAANAANIIFEKSSVEVIRILAGKAQTLMAIYTVPAGYTGYIYQGTASAESGADGTGDMFIRYFGETAFRIGHSFEVAGAGGEYNYQFSFPVQVPEKSDIDVRLSTRSNNGRYTAAFDILLVQEAVNVDNNDVAKY